MSRYEVRSFDVRSDDQKSDRINPRTVSSAHPPHALDNVLAAGFGRFGSPEISRDNCPGWLPDWVCTPIPTIIEENIMAKKPTPQKDGNKTSKTTTPKTGKSTDAPKNTKTSKDAPGKNPALNQDIRGTTTPDQNTVLTKVARLTEDARTTYSVNYPYSLDMFVQHARLYPAGVGGSLTRDHFLNSTGVKLDVEIQLALRRPNTVTVVNVADYINQVAYCYSLLVSMRSHLGSCFNDSNRSTIDQRVNLTFDNSLISTYARLARMLRADFLPPRVITMINRIYTTFVSGVSAFAPLFQFVPYDVDVNGVTGWETLLNNAMTDLNALTNRNDIITAYRSRSQVSFIPMVQLTGLPTFGEEEGEKKFLATGKPKFAPEMLDLWGNFTYAAHNVLGGRVVDFDLPTTQSLVTKFAFTKSFTALDNALTGRYVTTTAGYEPGILVPSYVMAGNSVTNLRHVNATGFMASTNNTGYGSYAFGALSMNGQYSWNDVNRNAIRIPQTSILRTTMHNVEQDAYEVMRSYMGIPLNQ
jgi:hypothetical protein